MLLYPHAAMEMGWCNYELGRFYDRKRPILCIKNIDIPKPPPAFQPYQAYNASPAELFKFLKELFVTGEFTNRQALNTDIANPASEFHARARDVCNVLAAQFTEARVREHFYERRLVIALHHDGGRLNHDKSTVQGNPEGLGLLGLGTNSVTPWAVVRKSLGSKGDWLSELEAALPAIVTGALSPVLPPFRTPSGIYLPIVVKAETADGLPRQLIVIFVSAGIERLLPMLGWSFPRAMPEGFTYLVQLVRSMFRSRWDVLEPRYQEARFKAPDAQRCGQIAQAVVADYDQLEKDFEQDGSSGLGRFYGAFHKDLRPEVEAASADWVQLTRRLREEAPSESEPLGLLLKALMDNNTRWLTLAAQQFSYSVADLP